MSMSFSARLLAWHRQHGRHDLPWQHPRSPYRIWLAEIMLQQTQVATVIPYYQRFLAALPDLPTLAHASLDQVLGLWSGLGYYSRARNLHASARLCIDHHGGELPQDFDALMALPGIGRSTAAAILAQAHGQRRAILDGNVRRVLARWSAESEWPGSPGAERRLWALSEALLPDTDLPDYTQAIMDLGASVCRRSKPDCGSCPVAMDCRALGEGLTTELPRPRPRRTLPTQERHFLLASDSGGRILLLRRPEQGIWGGLWCLPEFATAKALAADCALLGKRSPRRDPSRDFRHSFSHYHLHAQVWRLGLDHLNRQVAEAGPETLSLPQALSLGLPAPIRTLLASLAP